MTRQNFRNDRDGEEQEEVDKISFRLGSSFYHDEVEPPTPQHQILPQ